MLSRQARRRICQLGAKKLVSQHAARGAHGVPIEDREQRKLDEEELRRRLWKSAPATAYMEPVVQEDDTPRILLLGSEDEKRSEAGLILP
jgi:hypothetical protein